MRDKIASQRIGDSIWVICLAQIQCVTATPDSAEKYVEVWK
jgi:hypothetical protein